MEQPGIQFQECSEKQRPLRAGVAYHNESNRKEMKQYKYRVNGKSYDVAIDEVKGNNAKVTVNGVAYDVEIEGEAGEGIASISGVASPAAAAAASPAAQPKSAPAAAKPAAPAVAATGKGVPVKAPLPGVVTDIKVAVGDKVAKGQTVVVLEAMKMQNDINAESDGTITSVAVNKGDAVNEGATLVTIEQ